MNIWETFKSLFRPEIKEIVVEKTPEEISLEKKLTEQAPTTNQVLLSNSESLDLGNYDYPGRSLVIKEESFKVLDKVLEDPQVKACLNTLIYGILSQDYSITAKDTENSQRYKRFIELSLECFKGSIQNPLQELLRAGLPVGHALSEKIYCRFTDRDTTEFVGRLYIQDIRSRPTGGYDFKIDKFSNIEAIENLFTNEGEKYLDPEKFFIFIFEKMFSSPYGKGLIDSLFKLVYSKNHKFNNMNIHDTKFGSPTVGVEIPRDKEDTPGIIETAQSLAESIQSGNAVCYPEGLKVGVVGEGKSSSSSDVYIPRLKYIDSQISLVILGNDLTTTQSQSGGTHAETKTKFKVTTIFAKYLQTQIEEMINEQYIRDLLEFNFNALRQDYCYFEFVSEDTEETKDKESRIKTGVDIKVLKPEARVNDEIFIRAELKFPPLSEEEIKTRLEKEKQLLLLPSPVVNEDQQEQEPVSFALNLDLHDEVDVSLFQYED